MFKLFKKKECKCNESCCFNEKFNKSNLKINDISSIKVFGTGCSSCKKLYKNVVEVVKKLSIDVEVEYITNIEEMMKYNIMKSPVLMINDSIISSGKLLKVNEIEQIFKEII